MVQDTCTEAVDHPSNCGAPDLLVDETKWPQRLPVLPLVQLAQDLGAHKLCEVTVRPALSSQSVASCLQEDIKQLHKCHCLNV
jgi:hypothetical protein